MTITSLDNFGHASGSISMSELRDYYGKSGSVSLGLNLSGTDTAVPSSVPLYTQTLSFSDYRSENRVLKKKGITETVNSNYIASLGSTWTPAQSGCVQYNVWAVGGGGSGGAHSTDSGREKVASGGAAGGTAYRRYSVVDHSITSASVSIGAGGGGVSHTGGIGTVISGRNGGTTTFNPNGSGTTISATGGSRGFGGRQGLVNENVTSTSPVGEATSTTSHSHWGQCASSKAGTGSGGESNYTGGRSVGIQVGSDDEFARGGGSPNLGSGGENGLLGDGANTAATPAPTKPSEWGSDVTATFRGGFAACDNNGAAGASGAGAVYGAGSGGSAGENGAGSTGTGASGAVFVTYYEINT
jgi:hypothetical protein